MHYPESPKVNVTPNTFKIQNPNQEVSPEHTNEINEILHNTAAQMINATIKYLKRKVRQTLNVKNKKCKKM